MSVPKFHHCIRQSNSAQSDIPPVELHPSSLGQHQSLPHTQPQLNLMHQGHVASINVLVLHSNFITGENASIQRHLKQLMYAAPAYSSTKSVQKLF